MNHFHTPKGTLAKQLPQSSTATAAPTPMSQSELRDIVLAVLG